MDVAESIASCHCRRKKFLKCVPEKPEEYSRIGGIAVGKPGPRLALIPG